MKADDVNEKGSAPAGTGTKPKKPNLAGDDTDNFSDSLTFDKLAGRQFSLFHDAFTTEPGGMLNLGELLDGIKSGRWEQEIMQVRLILQKGGKEEYDEAKRHLPAVTLSGTVEGSRKNALAENRLHHSGILQIDVDAKDHPGATTRELLDRCLTSPHVLAAWLSPSGQGIKAVVPVFDSPELHLKSFQAAERHFQSLDLKIDASTKDAARLMFVSYDPDLWVRSGPVLLMKPIEYSGRTRENVPDTEDADTYAHDNVSEERVRNILSYIPAHPGYEDWIRIVWAVFSCLPVDVALRLLIEWSPEEKQGEYSRLSQERVGGSKVGIGTLLYYAGQHGYKDEIAIPVDVLPLPTGEIGYSRSARIIFRHLGPSHKLFMRGNLVCEIVGLKGQPPIVQKVSPERFMELAETTDKRVAQREVISIQGAGKKVIWRTKTMTQTAAKVLLESEGARIYLPHLRQLVNSPVIIERPGGTCNILTKGYHDFSGGTYILSDLKLETLPSGLCIAVGLVKQLLADFEFASPSDASRGIASLLSPALKMGGLIDGDFPLDVAEADQSQSGKTYRQQMINALYGEIPSVISSRKGGVGGLDESVANAMLLGRPFISIDNLRGTVESQLLETALRGHGVVNCRGFRKIGTIDSSPFIWQISTNGAEFTRDLANRSVITRIRKRPTGFRFRQYDECDVLAHLKKRRSLYLSAIFAIIAEWLARGKPQTSESRHDFREWTRSLDWIVQNLMGMPPLMDGHVEEQSRTSNPKIQWLREVIFAAEFRDFGRSLSTTDIVAITDDAGIDFPGSGISRESPPIRAGRILGSLFKCAVNEELRVDGFVVTRTKVPTNGEHGPKLQTRYMFAKDRASL